MMARLLLVLVLVATLVVMGHAVGAPSSDIDGAHCPTEDACNVDYHDGEWHIIESAP